MKDVKEFILLVNAHVRGLKRYSWTTFQWLRLTFVVTKFTL